MNKRSKTKFFALITVLAVAFAICVFIGDADTSSATSTSTNYWSEVQSLLNNDDYDEVVFESNEIGATSITIPNGKTLVIADTYGIGVAYGETLAIDSNGHLINYGSIDVYGTINVASNGTLTNRGTVTIMGVPEQPNDGLIVNNGTILNYFTIDLPDIEGNRGDLNNNGYLFTGTDDLYVKTGVHIDGADNIYVRVSSGLEQTYNGTKSPTIGEIYLNNGTMGQVNENTGSTNFTVGWNNDSPGAGSYTLILTSNDGNPEISEPPTYTINVPYLINKAPLTVTADNKNVTYGSAAPEFTVAYSGFVNSETASVLGGSLSYNCAYTTTSDVNSYSIIPSGLTSDNYDIQFFDGTLTVSNAEITGDIVQTGDLTYNTESQVATVDTSGLVAINDQTITVTYSNTIDGTYTAAVPGFTTSGNHMVYFKANALNHNEYAGTFVVAIDRATIDTPVIGSKAYTGHLQTADISETEFYDVTENDGGTTAGAYNVILTLKDEKWVNYKWTDVDTQAMTIVGGFVISKADIGTAWDVAAVADQTYTGSAIRPTLTVKFGEYDFVETTDYTIEWTNNINAGTATATLFPVDTGDFASVKIVNFTIVKANPVYVAPTAAAGLIYNGSPQELAAAGSNTTAGAFTYCATVDGSYLSAIPTGTNAAANYSVYFTFTPTDTDNYNTISAQLVSSTIAIAPKELTVTVSDSLTKVYKSDDPELSYTPTGMVGSETPGFTGAVTRAEGEDVGAYAISQGTLALADGTSGFKAANYTINFVGNNLTITKRTLTVTPDNGLTKVYGEADPALTYTYSGQFGSEVPGFTGALAREDGSNVGAYAISQGTLALADGTSGFKAANYQIDLEAEVFSITTKTLTISGLTASDHAYDRSTNVLANIVTSGGALEGVVGSDDVTIDYTGMTAVVESKDVASNKPVTIGDIVLSGTKATNYVLEQPDYVTINFTKIDITVTGTTASDKVYDGNTTATVDTYYSELSGIIAGDSVSMGRDGVTGAFADANVGTDKIVQLDGFTLGGADSGNYNLVQPTTTADITAATITGTLVQTGTITYNGVPQAATTSGLTSVNGQAISITYSLNDGGPYGVMPEFTDAGSYPVYFKAVAENHNDLTGSVTVTVGQREIVISGIAAENKVYNGDPVATLNYGSVVFTGIVEGDALTIYAEGTFEQSNVGNNLNVALSGLILGGADIDNYVLAAEGQQNSTTASITKLTAVLSWSADSLVYNSESQAPIATVTNLIPGDVCNVTVNGAQTNVGNYTATAVAFTGAAAGNYDMPAENSHDYSITPFQLHIADPSYVPSRVYDGTTVIDVTPGALTDLFAEDEGKVSVSATGSITTAGVGNDKAVSIVYALSGESAGNYIAPTDGAGTINITRALLTVTPGDLLIYFGTESPEFTSEITGFVNGETSSVVSGTVAYKVNGNDYYQTLAVGSYPIAVVVTGLTADNYSFTDGAAATLTISKAYYDMSGVTFSNGSLVYNGTAQQLAVSGVLPTGLDGIQVTVEYSGSATTVAQGAQTITATFATTSGNYNVPASMAAQLTITPAVVVVDKIGANDRVYDGTTNVELSYQGVVITGNLDGENLSVTAVGTIADPNAGLKTVTLSGLTLTGSAAGNYVLAAVGQQTSCDMTINKAPSAITVPPVASPVLYFENEAQELLADVGTATGGDLQYYVSTTVLENFEGIVFGNAYSATTAGTYYVYYKVNGGQNYVGVDADLANKVTATIEPSLRGIIWANNETSLNESGYIPDVPSWFPQGFELPTAAMIAEFGWTYEGHTPISLNTAADGTGTPFAFGTKVPITDLEALASEGVVNIYVHWGTTSVTHTVTYNVDGGSAAAPTQADVAEGGVFIVAAYSGTKTGYLFGGWNDGIKVYAAGDAYTVDTSNVTMTAVWNPIAYIVAFNANGGTGEMASLNATYGVEVTLTANTFTRTDYAFEGWATSATGATAYADAVKVINLTAENGATVTLYAVWIQVQKNESAAVVTVDTDFVSDQAADQLVNTAKEMKDTGTQNVTVDVNATSTDSVSIKSDSVKDAVDAGIGVNIATKNGVMEFSSAALKDKVAAGTTLKSEIKSVPVPAAYADKVPADTKVFSVTLTAGNTAITQFGGVFTVKVAYQATGSTDNLYVAYLAADGTLQKMDSYYEDGFMVFTTDHLSDYAILTDSGNGGGNTLVIVIVVVVIVLIAAGVGVFVFMKKKKN